MHWRQHLLTEHMNIGNKKMHHRIKVSLIFNVNQNLKLEFEYKTKHTSKSTKTWTKCKGRHGIELDET